MWLNRINPQLNIAWIGDWPHGFVEAARRIYDHELILFAAGECRVRVDDREFHCGPGTFMIVPPDRVHVTTAVSLEIVRRYCFHFDWIHSPRSKSLPHCVFLPGHLKRGGVRMAPNWVGRTLWHGRNSNPIATMQLAEKIGERWNGPDRTARSTCRALLLELLVRLLSAPSRRSRKLDRQGELAGRVKQLLDDRYSARDSIQALLEQLDFSYAHLCRVFKKQFGISPLSYINAGRVERAKTLLRLGDISVKSVAAATGFGDAAYFSRLFRKTVGVSPQAFRLR